MKKGFIGLCDGKVQGDFRTQLDLGVPIMALGQVSASFCLFHSFPALFYVLTPFSYSLSPCGDQVQYPILTGLFKTSGNEKENVLFLMIQAKSLAFIWTQPTTLAEGVVCPEWFRPMVPAASLKPGVESHSNT